MGRLVQIWCDRELSPAWLLPPGQDGSGMGLTPEPREGIRVYLQLLLGLSPWFPAVCSGSFCSSPDLLLSQASSFSRS